MAYLRTSTIFYVTKFFDISCICRVTPLYIFFTPIMSWASLCMQKTPYYRYYTLTPGILLHPCNNQQTATRVWNIYWHCWHWIWMETITFTQGTFYNMICYHVLLWFTNVIFWYLLKLLALNPDGNHCILHQVHFMIWFDIIYLCY